MTATKEYTIERIYKKNRHRSTPHPLDGMIAESGSALASHAVALEQRIQSLDNDHPLTYLDRLREFFLLALVCGKASSWPQALQQQLHETLSLGKWDTYQLVSALKAAIRHAALGQASTLTPHQRKSGAAPFQVPSYWPAGELPHHATHAELALVWYYLGMQMHQQHLIDAVSRVGQWQLTFALDHRQLPLNGLLTQESEGSSAHLLIWNYLLFRALGKAGHNLPFLSAADQHAVHLRDTPLALYPLALERWVESTITKSHHPENITATHTESDVESGVVIRRSTYITVLSSLAGSKSGVGAIIGNGVQIVSFGPQHLPFGDCEAFGLEQSPSAHFKRDITIERDAFRCHAKLRLAARAQASTSPSLFRREEMSGYWIDYTFDYSPQVINISSSFIGFRSVEGLAFAFFIKARSCRAGSDRVIALQSLDHFHGKLQPITFDGEDTSLSIHPDYEGGEMEVIPLAGGGSFWGADYLVGYRVNAQSPRMKWRLLTQ